MLKIIKKLCHTIESIYLCLRFPFLYPRNRFTGRHYDSWWINDLHRLSYRYTMDSFFIKVEHKKDYLKEEVFSDNFVRRFYSVDGRDYEIFQWDDKIKIVTFIPFRSEKTIISVDEILNTGYISDFGFDKKGNIRIFVSDNSEIKEDYNCMFNVVFNKPLLKIIRFLDWVNDKPLQWIHCIPTYTELDSMPYGWRRKFGIQMCKDIKKILIRCNALHIYRITNIKEKWGRLDWSGNLYNNDIIDILHHYSDLSTLYCLNCGKPTKYKTALTLDEGYILYLCDDCAGENKKYYHLISEINHDK